MLRNMHERPLTADELRQLERILASPHLDGEPRPLAVQWAALGAYANHIAETLGWFDRDYLRV